MVYIFLNPLFLNSVWLYIFKKSLSFEFIIKIDISPTIFPSINPNFKMEIFKKCYS